MANAHNVYAGPLELHRAQEAENLVLQIIVPLSQ